MHTWSTKSWQALPNSQRVEYPSQAAVDEVAQQLAKLPPLVTVFEINTLKKYLCEATMGQRFLLQGGDCAESFEDCNPEVITNKLKILLQMSLILIHGLHKPVIRVGRIAGQYAKPRSREFETIDGITLPSYRGDLINKAAFANQERTPDPQLLLQGYGCSALTLNYIRALVDGGFADLHHLEYWNLDFLKHSPLANEYQAIAESVAKSLDFLEAVAGSQVDSVNRIDFYTSHEALHLLYEQAFTRCEADGKYYNLSTHFPWIGMRTAQAGTAHVEYLRGISNPVAIKVGPQMTPELLIELIETLNPGNEPGRLTLIHRFGARQIADSLPPLISAARSTKKYVLWSCDPMHGNTEITAEGIKTRQFSDILQELELAFRIHHQLGSYLGGVHFELTGENVTECLGGARGLTTADLKHAYKTLVDPRLNYEQALEMAMLIVRNNQQR